MRYPLEGVDEHGKPRKTFRQYSFREVDGQTKWVARAPESNRPLYRLPQIAKMAAVVKPVMFSCRRFAPLVHKPGPVHPDFQNWNGTNIELRFCLGGGAFPPICAIPEWNHGPQLLPP